MARSPEAASSGDRGAVLAAFSRVLAREMHIPRHDPGLPWQQYYNRLQREDEPVRAVIEPEFERRNQPGAAPWLRTRSPFRESAALVRTLEGHTNAVSARTFSPNGARAVSPGYDKTVRLWDAEIGREIRTLTGSTARVLACTFSPDGTRVVSVDADKKLKVWDVETAECVATSPLAAVSSSVTHHPHRPIVVCGDTGGVVYLVELICVSMGPLVVTPVDLRHGLAIRCPVCFRLSPLQDGWLGREISCPQADCDASLRVNPFVVRRRTAGRADERC